MTDILDHFNNLNVAIKRYLITASSVSVLVLKFLHIKMDEKKSGTKSGNTKSCIKPHSALRFVDGKPSGYVTSQRPRSTQPSTLRGTVK